LTWAPQMEPLAADRRHPPVLLSLLLSAITRRLRRLRQAISGSRIESVRCFARGAWSGKSSGIEPTIPSEEVQRIGAP
jgi:hypothetical protein